jgi:hypothetical protein
MKGINLIVSIEWMPWDVSKNSIQSGERARLAPRFKRSVKLNASALPPCVSFIYPVFYASGL